MDIQNHLGAPDEIRGSKSSERIVGVPGRSAALHAATEAVPQDSAKVSHAAHLAEQVMQLPDVRQEKVNMAQKALVDGNYHLPAAELADSIMSSMSTRGQK